MSYMEKIGPKVKTPSGKGGENAVNIVSFHGSKGLQYPICIIAGAFHRFNDMDTKKALVMDRKLGVAFKMVDAENNASVDTIARKAIILKMKASLLSEELRVMYVALTRAEEKLIVLLTSANPKKRALAVAENDKVKGYIERFGGTITNVDDWGKKRMAYEVNRMREAFYYFIQFDAEKTAPREIENRVRLMENVVRYLVVKQDEA